MKGPTQGIQLVLCRTRRGRWGWGEPLWFGRGGEKESRKKQPGMTGHHLDHYQDGDRVGFRSPKMLIFETVPLLLNSSAHLASPTMVKAAYPVFQPELPFWVSCL